MRAAPIVWLALALLGCTREQQETIAHGRFAQVVTVRPAGAAPGSVAILLTDADGWTPAAEQFAHGLARDGALVIGVPLPPFYAELEKAAGGCDYTDGDLENLSHFVQAYYKLPGYVAPVLVGYGEGAAFAYANLAQAPAGTFGGAVTLGFCPQLALRRALCAGTALAGDKSERGFLLKPAAKLSAAWTSVQGEDQGACPAGAIEKFTGAPAAAAPASPRDFAAPAWRAALRAAYGRMVADNRPAPAKLPAVLADLPLVEMPAQGAAGAAAIAVFWSGDGGWAGLDQEVAGALVRRGVSVVGVDSLRYFWSARTPEKVAADIDRIVAYYADRWRARRVLLIGYSQGADILPFALDKLAPATRARVVLAAAMGLGDHAVFEFHLSNWVASVKQGYDTLAQVRKIRGTTFLCIYGAEEDDTICPQLTGDAVRVVELPGSHHFNGDYGRLAEEILKAAGVG